MSQKTIQLNPEFLSSISKKETRKREKHEKKTRASSLIKPNKLKKQLLDKIKDHQKRSEETKNNLLDKDEFSNDFNKSVEYLEQISKKREKRKNNKKTKKNRFLTSSIQNNIPVSTELPKDMNVTLPITSIATATISPMSTSIKHREVPPYSCLKNGSRPCYREWKKTTNQPQLKIEDKPMIQNTERSLKLQEIKDTRRKDNPTTQKQIKTTTYKLGKNK